MDLLILLLDLSVTHFFFSFYNYNISLTLYRNYIAGGVAVVYVGQPLDTVKVKMQTFPQLYKGMYHCLKQTLKNDGVIRGLYAGTTPAIIANVAENSVLFAAYGFCQKFVCQLNGIEVFLEVIFIN